MVISAMKLKDTYSLEDVQLLSHVRLFVTHNALTTNAEEVKLNNSMKT